MREGRGVLRLNNGTIGGCYKALRHEGWNASSLEHPNPKREPWETQKSSLMILCF
mgnify:CR=1